MRSMLNWWSGDKWQAAQGLVVDTMVDLTVPDGATRLIISTSRADEPPPPSVPTRENAPEFLAHVLGWLQHRGVDAVSVESVEGYGTDYEGSTEGGFYEKFEVSINYTRSDGKQRHLDANGEDMQSLWRWVINSWPAPERTESTGQSAEEAADIIRDTGA